MARLPTPGSDDGNWGDILNDFLSQAHSTSGALKPNSVDTAAIQDGAVTADKLSASGGSNGQLLSKNTGVGGGLQWTTAIDASRAINTTHSLTGGGNLTADRTLSLVNDAATPGNDKYYGTNGSGTRGYFDLPAGSAPSYPNNSGTATVVPRPSVTDVRDYGATGDGSTDDTAAISAAVTAAHAAGTAIYFPAGEYLVTSFPTLNNYDIVRGDGSDLSTIIYGGSGTLVTLTNKARVRFSHLNIWITGANGKGFQVSNSFSCSFESMVIRGNHTSDTYPTYLSSVGIRLDNNSGATMIINCLISNFGTGIATYCIQSYVSNCKLTTNYISILGSGNNDNAGLSISDTDIVSDTNPNTTSKHIYIDGAANSWWLSNVWFEGAATAVEVGVSGTGGPSSFSMINCHISARDYCIDLQHCRQPYLANILFANETGGPPTELRINATNAGEGTAINLITLLGSDIADNVFTEYWTVVGRGKSLMSRLDRQLKLRNTGTTDDILTALNSSYNDISAILSSGAFLSNAATAGIVLKSPDGHYWRVTVDNAGALGTADLGTGRPSS